MKMADKEAKNVFISFRFEDGNDYKEKLCDLFYKSIDTVDYSEDVDRSNQTEEQIKNSLWKVKEIEYHYNFINTKSIIL